jgi:NADPH-dependent curcumin reductase
MAVNRRIVLASRPKGAPSVDNFRLEEVPLANAGDGQVLVRNHFLSLDPYMRSRMDEAKSYAKPQALDEVMIGGTVGEVIESRHPKLAVGTFVVGALGWQEYAISDGTGLMAVDAKVTPLSVYLGALGMPGVTAWVGLLDLAQPKEGETVVVSAASGAVGSVVGQIAKTRGCRAVGIAGGRAKCDYVVNELGFDACVDYRAGRLTDALKDACPQGVDVYFENVGGAVLDAVLARMNAFGRVSVCGLISQYNAASSEELYGVRNVRSILTNRLAVQGFIVSDRMELWPRALKDLTGWYAAGRLKYRETVAQGLAAAPAAFLGLLRGENFGKQVVRLVS